MRHLFLVLWPLPALTHPWTAGNAQGGTASTAEVTCRKNPNCGLSCCCSVHRTDHLSSSPARRIKSQIRSERELRTVTSALQRRCKTRLSPQGDQSGALITQTLPEKLLEEIRQIGLDNAAVPVASYANCSGDDYKFSIFKPSIE